VESTKGGRAVSDDQQNEREMAGDDAKEDLEMTDEDADQVRGGLATKTPQLGSTEQLKEKW
jgi:hypothetical protein